jgi:hypothetical protein
MMGFYCIIAICKSEEEAILTEGEWYNRREQLREQRKVQVAGTEGQAVPGQAPEAEASQGVPEAVPTEGGDA